MIIVTRTTSDAPFQVWLTQHGDTYFIAAFADRRAAIAFADREWKNNRDHEDFTRGGDERAEWSVEELLNADSENTETRLLWVRKATA